MGCNQQVSALESGSGLGGQMIVERDRGCDRRLVILVPAEPGNRSAVQIQSAVQSVAAGIGRAVVMECFGVVIHVERRVGTTIAGFDQPVGGKRLIVEAIGVMIGVPVARSEEHTSELQSLMRIS